MTDATTPRPRADTFLPAEEDPRPDEPFFGDERATLMHYLRRYRTTLELKCAGLGPDDLARRSVPPSTLSLLGLVRHLADAERGWFRRTMAGLDAPAHYSSKTDPDGGFDGAVADPEVVADAWRTWRAEAAFTDEFVAAAPHLEITGHHPRHGRVLLRDVLVHMVEEYARHAGHADLLRECIDGRIGE